MANDQPKPKLCTRCGHPVNVHIEHPDYPMQMHCLEPDCPHEACGHRIEPFEAV